MRRMRKRNLVTTTHSSKSMYGRDRRISEETVVHKPPKLIRGAKTKEDTNKIIFLLRLMEIKMLRYTHKREIWRRMPSLDRNRNYTKKLILMM